MPLPFSPRPFLTRLRNKLHRTDLLSEAVRRIEIAPAIVKDRPAALSLPGEFQRARAFFESPAFEHARIAGGPREEGATVAYELRDAVIGGGTVYAGRSLTILRSDAVKTFLRGVSKEIDEAMLATTICAERYFGDWLIEAPSCELLAQRQGWEPVALARREWLHEPGYRALFDLHPRRVGYTRFGRLWMVDDRGLNANRAARLIELRRRVHARVESAAGPEKIFLTRGTLGAARQIVNDVALEEVLVADGFAIVHPETEAPATIQRVLRTARLVLCVEGSVQQHALVGLPEGAVLAIIQPPDRFTAPGKDYSDLVGIHYAFVVGDPAEGGFSVDVDRLRATLELAERVS